MPLSEAFWTMADRFMHFIETVTDCPMILCNDKGIIVKATVKSRIGTPHAGAQKILRNECDAYFVTAEEAANNPLVKEGYNAPIEINGERVATFGIAGKLELTRPLAQIAALVLAQWIRQMEQQEKLERASEGVFALADRLTVQIQEASTSAASLNRQMGDVGQSAVEKLDQIHTILNQVHRIAQQSHILSVNGAVEAARAGEYGRAFSVVVEEMGQLAVNTRKTADRIQETLTDMRSSIQAMNDSIDLSVRHTRKQIDMMTEIVRRVESLQEHFLALKASFSQ